ncbi:hypothetical protein KAH37_03675 [bacterium]|nr:hypothetical protein [bacterium]
MEKLSLLYTSIIPILVILLFGSPLFAEDLVLEEMSETEKKAEKAAPVEKAAPAKKKAEPKKDPSASKQPAPLEKGEQSERPGEKVEQANIAPTSFVVAPVSDSTAAFNPQILTIATDLFTKGLTENNITVLKEATKESATISVAITAKEAGKLMTVTVMHNGKELIAPQSKPFTGMGEIKPTLQELSSQTAANIVKVTPKKEVVSPPVVVAATALPVKDVPIKVDKAETEKNPSVSQLPAPLDKGEQSEKKEEKKPEEKKKFRKGKLANVGSNYIVSPFNRAVLAIGMTKIKDDYYLTLDPRVSINAHKIGLLMGFHLPFNIQMFSTDFTEGDSGQFKLRSEDWDEWQDYLKVIQYIEYGNSEDNLYFAMGSNFAQTLGHGTIMKNYIPNLDPTTSTLSMRLNYYNDYFGFETIFGDIGKGNMFGGLVFIKPLSIFLHDYHSQSLSFGFSFMADRNAPTQLGFVSYPGMPDPNTDDWDTMNAALAAAGAPTRNRRVAADEHNRPVVASDKFLYLMGLDTEFKFYKNEFVDIKSFVDYSWMGTDMKQGGVTVGLLNRFNLDKKRKHAMRVQLEYRYSMNGYLPSFFNMYYDVERIEMVTNTFGYDNFSPDGRSKYWHAQQQNMDFSSYYWEWSYSFDQWLTLSTGMEFYPDSYSWFAYLELPDLWILSAMLTYVQKGIKYGTTLGEDFQFNAMLKGVVRIQVLPIMFIDAYASRTDMFWNEEIPRKEDNYRGHYVAAWQWGFDIEIGWEWGNRTGKDAKKEK